MGLGLQPLPLSPPPHCGSLFRGLPFPRRVRERGGGGVPTAASCRRRGGGRRPDGVCRLLLSSLPQSPLPRGCACWTLTLGVIDGERRPRGWACCAFHTVGEDPLVAAVLSLGGRPPAGSFGLRSGLTSSGPRRYALPSFHIPPPPRAVWLCRGCAWLVDCVALSFFFSSLLFLCPPALSPLLWMCLLCARCLSLTGTPPSCTHKSGALGAPSPRLAGPSR